MFLRYSIKNDLNIIETEDTKIFCKTINNADKTLNDVLKYIIRKK